jgi:hypothetical protein
MKQIQDLKFEVLSHPLYSPDWHRAIFTSFGP